MSEALALAAEPWAEASLDDALTRLDHTLGRMRAGGASAVSFDAGGSSPELELMRGLAPSTGAVSFGLGGGSDEGESEAGARAFLDSLLTQARAAARIETKVRGKVVAWTTIGLGGDTHSAIAASISEAARERHRAAVAATLRTRQARMRIVLATLDVAAKVALAAGTGNPLLALRAAARFVHGVMDEWDQKTRAA